jgi:acyl-CoA thioesterase-1
MLLATPEKVVADGVTTVLFIGDSLTEGYGVRKEEAFPELVVKHLATKKQSVRIVNGGISGSLSADADRRLRWFLKQEPQVLVLALGANDALKGTPPEVIKKNLAAVIDLALEKKIRVLLCGIKVFGNFGVEYNRSIDKMYGDLAREKKVAFYPFLLEGVALDKSLNQVDGKHPNAKGHEVIARKIAVKLEKIL